MKKKSLYIILMSVLMICVLAACGKKDKQQDKEDDAYAEIKPDLVEFVNKELPAIEGDRNTDVSIYNSYFASSDVKLEQFSSDLQNTAIPKMQTYMDNLNAIEVSTDEVKALKDIYVQSSQKQLDAMNKVAAAINEQNPDYLAEADTMIKESEELLIQYQTELRTLAMNAGITVNGDLNSGSTDDAAPADTEAPEGEQVEEQAE